jgi:NitT/TauT family transport system permease protein
MASLICFFPAVVNGTIGLRSVQPEALALFRAISASRWTVFWRLRLPSALPQLFAAFKVSAPASVLAAMIAEWLAANGGLGYLILDAADSYRFTLMWAGVAAATVLAVVAFALVNLLERRLVNWPIEA